MGFVLFFLLAVVCVGGGGWLVYGWGWCLLLGLGGVLVGLAGGGVPVGAGFFWVGGVGGCGCVG